MNVLLLRLVGPMQSWGVQSRFSVRDTGLEPSKSGVIGLICAALGRARSEPVADLAAFKMGVRVENMIHLTENGPVDLMADIPIEADDIEALMARTKRPTRRR